MVCALIVSESLSDREGDIHSLQIEIKMKKVDGIRWATLEGDGEPPFVKANLPGKSDRSTLISCSVDNNQHKVNNLYLERPYSCTFRLTVLLWFKV